jgi:hypothetical protein
MSIPAELDHDADVVLADAAKRIAGLEAENERLQEEHDDITARYHSLAQEMIYEGNSVWYWRNKALAYKGCAGFVYDVKELLKALQGGAS